MREVEQAAENESEGREETLPYAFKVAALRKILIGKIGELIKMREPSLMASLTEIGKAKCTNIYEEM
jgi:hypothetical protein